jgi:hypothetical protein
VGLSTRAYAIGDSRVAADGADAVGPIPIPANHAPRFSSVAFSASLCRLASGGSFAVRLLYTHDEEVVFQAVRPILLNGIEDVISRPDLPTARTAP